MHHVQSPEACKQAHNSECAPQKQLLIKVRNTRKPYPAQAANTVPDETLHGRAGRLDARCLAAGLQKLRAGVLQVGVKSAVTNEDEKEDHNVNRCEVCSGQAAGIRLDNDPTRLQQQERSDLDAEFDS